VFKSLTIYQITLPTRVLLERLPIALEKHKFQKCLKKQPRSRGYVPPLGHGEEITYGANGGTLFCLRTDEKTVPSSAVKELLQERRAKVEKEDKEFSKVDERVAKEAIIEGFLPGIPPATSLTYAYVDSVQGLFYLGASGDAADEFTKFLGDAMGGTAPLKLLGIKDDPCDKFTAWVQNTALLGDDFELGTQGALKHEGTEGGVGIMNIRHEDFGSPELLSLIEAGRKVCSISLVHEDMEFRLTSSLGIRNIRLGAEVLAEAADDDGKIERPEEFASFVPAMRAVMGALDPLFGGWPKQEILDLQDREDAA
jgi:recombination associated protein RdgC